MFYTYSEAEFQVPAALASFGQKTWSWIELSLHIPIYFLTASVESEDGLFTRNYLFGQLTDVLVFIGESNNLTSDVELRLLSPGYMNGSKSYQLGKIKEIWVHREDQIQMFVMSDETVLQFPPNEECMKKQDMDLVLSL